MPAPPSTEYSIADSEAAFLKARQLMPGGVSSPVRSFNAVGGTPVFIKEAEGAILTDLDNNKYIDYIGAYGPLIAGHANERVVAALSKAIGRGTSYGCPTEYETNLAQLITEALPSVEMLRFVNSGTEATMSAIRLARAAGRGGRDKIIKCIGCYHGHADALLAKAGSGVLTHASPSPKSTAKKAKTPKSKADVETIPSTPGVPESTVADTLLVHYNDLDAAEAIFEENEGAVAAFIVEPIAGNMGVVPPSQGYLEGLRALCSRHGALLIFDEVMTGFRVAWGGAQIRYNTKPDLTCLGKVIGGGLPVGAYGGSRELMEMISPSGPVYQAGTLSGNPLAMAGGQSTLEILQEAPPPDTPTSYEVLETRSARLAEGLLNAAKDAGVNISINRVGSMLTPFFTKGPVTNYSEATASDTAAYAAFFHAMLKNGVHLPPSQYEAWFVSLAHTDEIIDETLKAAEKSFKAVSGK